MGIKVQELPTWLQAMLEKQLSKRISKDDCSAMMEQTLDDLAEIFDPKQYVFNRIRSNMPAFRVEDSVIATLTWKDEEAIIIRIDDMDNICSYKILYRAEASRNPLGKWETLYEKTYEGTYGLIKNEIRDFDIKKVAKKYKIGKE